MITLNDIKNKLKLVPGKVKETIKKKMITWVVSDVARTWVGEIYRCEPQPDGTFREVKIGKNSVLLGGLQELAYLLYHIPFEVAIGTFEDDLWSGSADSSQKTECTYDKNALPFIQGFNLGQDGVSATDLRPVARHKKGYGPNLEGMIPFRVIPESENDFAVYRPKYLHHRHITIEGKKYIAYYTKKCQITYEALLDNDQKIPQNPDTNLVTDRDSRIVAEFTLNIEEDELVEWFRLTSSGGPESTSYSAIMLMIGKAGKWNKPDSSESYDTTMETYVFSRANCAQVPHGIDSAVICKYRMLHI